MADWWLADAQGRVLGPVTEDVVRELWSTRAIADNTRVSWDGQVWYPITDYPHLLGETETPAQREAKQREEAAKLAARLDQLRGRPAHELFGVAQDASLEQIREAFFRISKRFHPDRLPSPAVPELRDASLAVFRFLSGTFTRLENDRKRTAASAPPRIAPLPTRPVSEPRRAAVAPPVPPPPPAATLAPPVPPSPPPATPVPPGEDRYGPETFVGLEPGPNGEFEASIRVSPRTVSMFYEHPLVNFRQGGMFVSGSRVLPLGSRLMVTLDFDDPPRTIVARAYVTYECAQGRGMKGFGVMLSGMGKEDRAFVEDYVNRKRPKPKAKPPSARA